MNRAMIEPQAREGKVKLVTGGTSPSVASISDQRITSLYRFLVDLQKHLAGHGPSFMGPAYHRLTTILLWRCFLARYPTVPLTRARDLFVRSQRGRGISISRNSLYRWVDRLEKFGIGGLIDNYRGGVPSPIPEEELAFLHDISQSSGWVSFREMYNGYRRLRAHTNLPGPPLGFPRWRRAFEKLLLQSGQKDRKHERRRARGGR